MKDYPTPYSKWLVALVRNEPMPGVTPWDSGPTKEEALAKMIKSAGKLSKRFRVHVYPCRPDAFVDKHGLAGVDHTRRTTWRVVRHTEGHELGSIRTYLFECRVDEGEYVCDECGSADIHPARFAELTINGVKSEHPGSAHLEFLPDLELIWCPECETATCNAITRREYEEENQ